MQMTSTSKCQLLINSQLQAMKALEKAIRDKIDPMATLIVREDKSIMVSVLFSEYDKRCMIYTNKYNRIVLDNLFTSYQIFDERFHILGVFLTNLESLNFSRSFPKKALLLMLISFLQLRKIPVRFDK